MQFFGLSFEERLKDVTVVWLCREQLQQWELVEALFE